MQSFPVQFWDLLLIQLTNWRWSWRSHLLLSTLAPLLSTLALGVFAADDGVTTRSYIVTGSVVMSLLFGIVGQISGHIAFIRHTGQLDFFATLPIARAAFILATVCAFFLISLPSALVTLALGAAFSGVTLVIQPLILLVLPLLSISLCGIGVLIGLLSRNINESGMITNLVTLLLTGTALIPPALLPPGLQIVNLLSPAAYAAAALRHVTLAVPETIPLELSFAMLTGAGALFMWMAVRRVPWHQ